MCKQPDIQSPNSLDRASRVRIIGRGGSGSQLRVVALEPEALQLELHREQPASLSLSTGYGGGRSRQRFVSATPTLLSIPRRQKRQAGKKRRSTYSHPISPQASLPSYQTTNQSASPLSAIQSDRQTGPPRPFFPLDVEHNSSDNTSLPPASTFDFAVRDACSIFQTPSTEDFNLDEESQCPMLEHHRKRSINKLARTLGDLPPNNLYNLIPRGQLGKREFLPNLIIDDKPTKKDQNVFRRARHSLSSLNLVFVQPSGRRQGSIYSLSTPTEDFHQVNLGDDDFTNLSSGCSSPGSPICFMSASLDTNPETPNSSDLPAEAEQESLSGSSHSPSLSHPDSDRPRQWNRLSHSASTSLSSNDPLFNPSTISTSTPCVFPPQDDHEAVTLPITSNPTEKSQSWTGEWNNEMNDVIRALRVLH